MEKRWNIIELRERLDKTLRLPDLVSEESVKSLVKNQLLHSSFRGSEGDLANVVARRTKEVSNFLDMLRSASGNEREAFNAHGVSHSDWKIKQDSDQVRVMYREGPHGSPFHTLLTEGFADGPVDVCLCVSWESTLYKKWWPQYNIPTFKITTSTCLEKVLVGEEISLIRMKVPWPVSDREAIVHYFEIEYLKEDLILVLVSTISDEEHIDISTHGFSRDGIPEAKDTVRIDLVGGFVLQKTSASRSYFRAIANMDIKLDIMPPSLINFISRQIIGNGHKLYQKAVGSVATSDEDYREALRGPMYARIRERLDFYNKFKTSPVAFEQDEHAGQFPERNKAEIPERDLPPLYNTSVAEIIEEETMQIPSLEGNQPLTDTTTNTTTDEQILISPEVEQALGILDRVISIVRGSSSSDISTGRSSAVQDLPTLETIAKAGTLGETDALKTMNMVKPFDEAEGRPSAQYFRHNVVDYTLDESNMFSLERPSDSGNTHDSTSSCSSHDKLAKAAVPPPPPPASDSTKVCDEESLKANGVHDSGWYSGKSKSNRKKKQRACCFSLSLIRRF